MGEVRDVYVHACEHGMLITYKWYGGDILCMWIQISDYKNPIFCGGQRSNEVKKGQILNSKKESLDKCHVWYVDPPVCKYQKQVIFFSSFEVKEVKSLMAL